ncbi:hypothetical protein CHUAL_006762 [Chamberlinius hualienensis]
MSDINDNSVIGDCIGPDSVYIKLISSDHHEFIIKRKHVLVSETIVCMLYGPGLCKEDEINEIYFRDLPSLILQKVCMYLNYRANDPDGLKHRMDFDMEPAILFEMLSAAFFLLC